MAPRPSAGQAFFCTDRSITINTSRLFIPLLAGLLATPLYAADPYRHSNHIHDQARVLEATSLIDIVEIPVEHRECWTEEVYGSRSTHSSGIGMLVGSIIGGVVGNQLGKGDRRKVATVAGTVLGATIGHNNDRRPKSEPYHTTEQRCRVQTSYVQEERLRGYHITYRYQGKTFTTETRHHPGKFITVRVHVSQVD